MTEKEMKEYKVGFPQTEEELLTIIKKVVGQDHDYGTCVYAMSIAAQAAFNYVSYKLGTTGFQTSLADLDFLKRTRGMEHGFKILNFTHLLYPQYQEEFRITPEQLITNNINHLGKIAKEKLIESEKGDYPVSPNVTAHWSMIVNQYDKKMKNEEYEEVE